MADVIVGRFALIDLIAKGGSGAVWRAWDAKAEQLCAAKVLRQRDSADLMRFVREKGVSFDHPHLVTPYGWGAEDEHVVIAMPLVSGGTLESVVRQHGKLSEPATVVILDQLLDGLQHVHEAGWIHRDVKPANIMFEPRGTARPHSHLADFGIAVHETDVRFTHVGMVNGTPGYMAPELFAMAEPAPSHDLYAAGVVALVALNGPLKLRDGAFRPEELDRLLRGVSPKLAAVIRRLVAAQPEDRYQDAASVRRDLPRVPEGLTLTHADGSPLSFTDTLPPLPPDAPAAARAGKQEPPTGGPSMEAIRTGRVQQVSSAPAARAATAARSAAQQSGTSVHRGGAPRTTSGPRQGAVLAQRPSAPPSVRPQPAQRPGGRAASAGLTASMPSPSIGPSPGSGATGERPRPRASGRRRGMIAAGVGGTLVVLLGALVAVGLLVLVPGGTTESTETGADAYGEVSVGQSCTEEDLGLIGVTADGTYVSCRPDQEGYAYR